MTETDIANRALARVGGQRIGSLDDGTKGARACKDLLPELREVLLEHALWGFATKVKDLAEKATAPPGALAAFTLPTDCVRVAYINDRPFKELEQQGWRVEGSDIVILTGRFAAPLRVQYVSRTTPISQYSAGATQALALMLAAELALVIPESKTLHDRLINRAENQLYRAAARDAVQGSSEVRKRGRLHSARLSGTSFTGFD